MLCWLNDSELWIVSFWDSDAAESGVEMMVIALGTWDLHVVALNENLELDLWKIDVMITDNYW